MSSLTIALASGNAGKLREFAALLAPLDATIVSQAELGVSEAVEDGATFIENALKKARHVSAASKLPAIADDSGIVVPALAGAPGIHSARYAGTHGDSAANNAKLLAALEGVTERAAYFYCALVYLGRADDPAPLIATAAWHGRIALEPSGDGGFGYDPIFLPSGETVSSAEMASAAKAQVSHRGKATRALLAQLSALLTAKTSTEQPPVGPTR